MKQRRSWPMGSDSKTIICASKGKKLKGETTDYESFRLKILGEVL